LQPGKRRALTRGQGYRQNATDSATDGKRLSEGAVLSIKSHQKKGSKTLVKRKKQVSIGFASRESQEGKRGRAVKATKRVTGAAEKGVRIFYACCLSVSLEKSLGGEFVMGGEGEKNRNWRTEMEKSGRKRGGELGTGSNTEYRTLVLLRYLFKNAGLGKEGKGSPVMPAFLRTKWGGERLVPCCSDEKVFKGEGSNRRRKGRGGRREERGGYKGTLGSQDGGGVKMGPHEDQTDLAEVTPSLTALLISLQATHR